MPYIEREIIEYVKMTNCEYWQKYGRDPHKVFGDHYEDSPINCLRIYDVPARKVVIEKVTLAELSKCQTAQVEAVVFQLEEVNR